MADLRIEKRHASAEHVALERAAVAGMAALVRDEEHWRQVLASAPTDEHRAELDRVVGPFLSFRRAAVCTTPGCVTSEQGMWQPVLVVCSPIDPEDRAYVPIELRLCETCKGGAQLEDFLTDDIWRQIMSAWSEPTIPPVRRRTTLQWDRIH